MRAVDTNLLARFYLQDEATQGGIAAEVLSLGDVFVPKTVILELEWVLRYVAEQPDGKVLDCIDHLIRLPGIVVEDRDEVESALTHSRRGIDFADALHLAASKECSELLTFDDRGYARKASKLRLKPPVRVPR